MLYDIGDRAYLSLTNRCPTACRFCVKRRRKMRFEGFDLRLGREPSVPEVLAGLRERFERGLPRELVFCGYGECTYRLGAIAAAGAYARSRGVPTRLNTIGLGNLIWKRDIVRFLSRCVDEVSVSLNTADPAQWEDLHRPAPEFRGVGHAAARVFAARCVEVGLKTTVTAVALEGVDLGAVRAFARSIGARWRERPLLA